MKKNRSARKSFPIYLIEKLNLKERARAHVPEERSSTLKNSSRNLSFSSSYTSARLGKTVSRGKTARGLGKRLPATFLQFEGIRRRGRKVDSIIIFLRRMQKYPLNE